VMLKVFIILITLFQDTLSGNVIIIQTPDILTISYIKNNPNFYDYCDQQLENVVRINEYHSFTACKGLSDSANNDLPTNFSNMNGIGYLVSANPRDSNYHNQENPTKNLEKIADAKCNPYSYTKIPQAPWGTYWLYQTCSVGYEQADIYMENPTFNGFQSKPINSNTCLNIHNFKTSQLSPCAQCA
ncbi:14964_t:CDS:2, partial [Dentiscutata heterogama]